MKTFDLNTNNQSKRNRTRILVLFVLLVLSSMGVFGQNNTPVEKFGCMDFEVVNTSISINQGVASIESQIDFMGWFMGSKYNQNNSNLNSTESNKSTISTKKQILSSGIEPNKVLYRTFVKKVMNKDNAIA
jgi:hypothetical protein